MKPGESGWKGSLGRLELERPVFLTALPKTNEQRRGEERKKERDEGKGEDFPGQCSVETHLSSLHSPAYPGTLVSEGLTSPWARSPGDELGLKGQLRDVNYIKAPFTCYEIHFQDNHLCQPAVSQSTLAMQELLSSKDYCHAAIMTESNTSSPSPSDVCGAFQYPPVYYELVT